MGYLDPETGDADIYRVPEVPGRPSAGAMLYGLIMTADRKHVWYSQLGIGRFNIETLEFEESVQLPIIHSGPRRLTISGAEPAKRATGASCPWSPANTSRRRKRARSRPGSWTWARPDGRIPPAADYHRDT